MDKPHYNKLTRVFTRLARFDHLNAIASWDMATMMPPKGSQARGEALAELSVLRHQILSDKHNSQLIEAAKQEDLSPAERANLTEIERLYHQAIVLPEHLVEEKSLAGSRCEHGWRIQRPANDWQGFSSNLKEVVRLSRQEAELRAQATGVSPYDALLSLYEPQMRSAQLDKLFGELATWLPGLLTEVIDKQHQHPILDLAGPFAVAAQKNLALDVMAQLGFDFDGGRLDVSAHPFCGGVAQDVRITTRYSETDLFSALFGVIHETGHARYEQNLPTQFGDQPIALARSMGIHESQSLFFEMQLGRSREFLNQLRPRVEHYFGHQPAFEADNFILMNQRVTRGLIRVEADEVSYPAHVILRYEIEKALIGHDIEVDDIPALWDEKMKSWLGLSTVGNYRDGCMQDIHWTDGSFGYFPSYTLGAMYAAQFKAAMAKSVDIAGAINNGDLTPIFNWLADNIWSKGSQLSTDELVLQASGEPLNAAHFKSHLFSRYLSR